jgi:hypothetical protein
VCPASKVVGRVSVRYGSPKRASSSLAAHEATAAHPRGKTVRSRRARTTDAATLQSFTFGRTVTPGHPGAAWLPVDAGSVSWAVGFFGHQAAASAAAKPVCPGPLLLPLEVGILSIRGPSRLGGWFRHDPAAGRIPGHSRPRGGHSCLGPGKGLRPSHPSQGIARKHRAEARHAAVDHRRFFLTPLSNHENQGVRKTTYRSVTLYTAFQTGRN